MIAAGMAGEIIAINIQGSHAWNQTAHEEFAHWRQTHASSTSSTEPLSARKAFAILSIDAQTSGSSSVSYLHIRRWDAEQLPKFW